ncbi:transmembrane protein, putative (macronuclear) [Tetrahymena thermophila SB210]|uniref:Transmembrane protein, putative n=1 Tax=Tetrahymena thermophila (strain SB210) TaxID=312017 RepID=W7X5C0_TETTS|nr:transmembrane protein, putative [Tetrahymena thermophila SB210]EWS72602.1 transmembrane protein, putative [Tetrahymena thermophila SB210]|eukprot:XP_012654885.1 transmembrane protein, putative [Tetrahymena thermophila SB210]
MKKLIIVSKLQLNKKKQEEIDHKLINLKKESLFVLQLKDIIMKYYKEDILGRWTAKFKDTLLEQSFHKECFSKRFKIAYLICVQIIVFSSLQIIFFSERTIMLYSQIFAPLVLMVLIKFIPMKYSQYLIMIGQIYSTFSICSRNTKEPHKSFEIYYINGIVYHSLNNHLLYH